MNYLKTILSIVVIVGFLFVFLSKFIMLAIENIFGSIPGYVEGFYIGLNWVLPVLAAALIAMLFFAPRNFKKNRREKSIVIKILANLGGIILIALTAIISWVVVTFMGFVNGTYVSSTYGTPIYRPQVK
jgi:hypothetical protein